MPKFAKKGYMQMHRESRNLTRNNMGMTGSNLGLSCYLQTFSNKNDRIWKAFGHTMQGATLSCWMEVGTVGLNLCYFNLIYIFQFVLSQTYL